MDSSGIKCLRLGLCICALFTTVASAQTSQVQARIQKERALLQSIEQIRGATGGFSVALVRPLRDLGLLYVQSDRCIDAIAALDQAIGIMRADEGFFSTSQLELFDPVQECYVALGAYPEFQRLQEYRLLIAEKTFGKDNPEILQMLARIAGWYEEAGFYISARVIHFRAGQIVERTGGKNDLRLIQPLRGIARAFRLEYAHGVNETDEKLNRNSWMRSEAKLQLPDMQLDRKGESALLRAVKILEQAPEPRPAELAETLLELGDWYQVGRFRPEAVRAYTRAWLASDSRNDARHGLLEQPDPLRFRSSLGVRMLRPPVDRTDVYWADFDYTVRRDGRLSEIKIVESNAPRTIRWSLMRDLQNTRHRPRFVDGEPVDTPHVQRRQWIRVEN